MRSGFVMETAKSEKYRAARINAVVKELQLSNPSHVRRKAVLLLANGININDIAASTGAAAVTQIFNNNGDPILKQSSMEMREKVIGVAFSYTKLSPSRVLDFPVIEEYPDHQ